MARKSPFCTAAVLALGLSGTAAHRAALARDHQEPSSRATPAETGAPPPAKYARSMSSGEIPEGTTAQACVDAARGVIAANGLTLISGGVSPDGRQGLMQGRSADGVEYRAWCLLPARTVVVSGVGPRPEQGIINNVALNIARSLVVAFPRPRPQPEEPQSGRN